VPSKGYKTYASRGSVIIHRQELLAIRLLDRALGQKTNYKHRPHAPSGEAEVPIDVQLDVFSKVGQWVAVKNRLEDQGQESQLDRFKQRIHADAADPDAVNKKRAYQSGVVTPALDRLKTRLPGADAGSNGGDSNGAGGAVDSAS